MPNRSRFCRNLLVAALGSYMCAAHAGSISFSLALTGASLALVNTGDSVAFFPGALAMRADGGWEPLAPPPGRKTPTQLAPGERLELVWPDVRPPEVLSAIERLRPTMVRFNDQAGVGFGQISFFTVPPPAAATVSAGYSGGMLRLAPPSGDAIRATWVLWPQEAGIAGIRQAFTGDVNQPPARHIEWLKNQTTVSFLTGAGLPAVTLIHETAQGYQLQRVASGWPGGKQQRAVWLELNAVFYALAICFAILAAGAALRSWWRPTRGAGSA
ncbi:MAG: hypothetical protein D4R84_11155 [Rhodocyclaceae bacterium]|nr:MAG: hypothetical protein D4R84_11155 [Rhodocyclaceae bacterium]